MTIKDVLFALVMTEQKFATNLLNYSTKKAKL